MLTRRLKEEKIKDLLFCDFRRYFNAQNSCVQKLFYKVQIKMSLINYVAILYNSQEKKKSFLVFIFII